MIKAGQGGVLAAILPQGMRAISTKIRAETAAGSLILPNDHVDVILIRRLHDRGGQDDTVVDTLFRNVRVIAIGQQIEIKEGKKICGQFGDDGNLGTDAASSRDDGARKFDGRNHAVAAQRCRSEFGSGARRRFGFQ